MTTLIENLKTKQQYFPTLGFAGALLVAFTVGKTDGFSAIAIDQVDLSTIVSALSALFVVALLIERSVEVAMLFLYSRTESKISEPAIKAIGELRLKENNAVRVAQNIDSPHQMAESIGRALPDVSALRQSAAIKYGEARASLSELKSQKQAVAIGLSLAIGLAISIVGFRILDALVCAFQSAGCAQIVTGNWFRSLDIVITSLVLAGGAEGIHALIKRILGSKSELSELATLQKETLSL